MSFSYISLFSGAGGLDIGLERSGLCPVSLCEIEANFCSTLKANKGWIHCDGKSYLDGAEIFNADIRQMSGKELAVKRVDLVVGGPPCQAFSSSGKQLSVLDPRGALVIEFCRIVSELKPKMFIFENVRGIVTARDQKGAPGGVMVGLLDTLQSLGYSCRAGLLNSADFGAYQRRVRCFIIGSRNGLAPDFPAATYTKSGDLLGKKWNSLRGFLTNLGDTNEENYVYPSDELRRALDSLPNGSGIKSPGKSEKTRPGGHWGYRQGTFISDLDLPARTVTGSASQDWVRWGGVLRRLTINEVKQLQGFPSDWVVCGSKAEQFKQIGNAVPAVFGEQLGKVVLDHLANYPRTKPIKLGIPDAFRKYIDYTVRDHERNKDSRAIHKHFGQ
jgi:DNA (cytosine-5)-methyltransferase 1